IAPDAGRPGQLEDEVWHSSARLAGTWRDDHRQWQNLVEAWRFVQPCNAARPAIAELSRITILPARQAIAVRALPSRTLTQVSTYDRSNESFENLAGQLYLDTPSAAVDIDAICVARPNTGPHPATND